MIGKSYRGRWLLATAVSLGIGTAVMASVPAATASVSSASAAPKTVITMFSDPGDYIGGGVQQEFDGTNASVTGTASTAGINLSVSGGTSGQSGSFLIDPPTGTSFHVGYYPKVQRAEFRVAGYAGLDITGAGRGCNTDTGAIDIRDLAVSGSVITRLDLLYEQHCEGVQAALFGQVRIGEPQTSGLIISSSSITWPAWPGFGSGAHGTTVPVYVRNAGTSPASIGSASLQGLAARDFSLVINACSGAVLAPGDSCDLYIRFSASARGPRSAVLMLPVGTHSYAVQLDALVRPGTTSLTMKSQAGDFIGQGQNYAFTPASARFTFLASPTGLEADLSANDGQTWTVDMYPASGNVLSVGTYPNATRYPFNGSGNGLSVYGDGRGCNTLTGSFTVKQVAFSPVDNSLRNFDGTFVQHCEGGAPALTGELKYDAEPVTTPPAGVTHLNAVATSSGLNITWTNPTTTNYSYTVVRLESSGTLAGVSPISGAAVYAGTGAKAVAHGLQSGHIYTVVAYTVDQYGNISAPAKHAVTF